VRWYALRNSPIIREEGARVNYLDTMCGNGTFTMMGESPIAGSAAAPGGNAATVSAPGALVFA
jgi:hypothetical protein